MAGDYGWLRTCAEAIVSIRPFGFSQATHRCSVTRFGWAMEADFGAHLARIKTHLASGREVLVSMHGGEATAYDVPNAHPDPLLVTLDPPNADDK